ncbi:hypothetical protein BpHYR1_001514 [Brachionus plicatilis]|uniref:Uncharacterized protein n=1 Tax=Brachionus plicatilis TaxID=10195 RepID=A0A3M7QSY6_BRAPC|nr:hypothetical protein BpHYR1_001514 [Brachionus plicatilis]
MKRNLFAQILQTSAEVLYEISQWRQLVILIGRKSSALKVKMFYDCISCLQIKAWIKVSSWLLHKAIQELMFPL